MESVQKGIIVLGLLKTPSQEQNRTTTVLVFVFQTVQFQNTFDFVRVKCLPSGQDWAVPGLQPLNHIAKGKVMTSQGKSNCCWEELDWMANPRKDYDSFLLYQLFISPSAIHLFIFLACFYPAVFFCLFYCIVVVFVDSQEICKDNLKLNSVGLCRSS